jgi:hypothetical protein
MQTAWGRSLRWSGDCEVGEKALGQGKGSKRRFRLVATGTLAGPFLSYALARLLASQISDVSATNPWTFAAVAMFVVMVGLAACLLPARRATRVDPLVALRYE